ncbi:hypothetical protein FRB90_005053 [Tulasnella sp. 427]|nr:hypothetical protein FRB90_005053 [Tulasnella sp. 427]
MSVRVTGLNPEDVSITFLQTHYTIERWREALLWSFVVGTVGGDDDQWTEEQMRAAWMRLGGDSMRREASVKRGRRRTTAEEEGRGGRLGLLLGAGHAPGESVHPASRRMLHHPRGRKGRREEEDGLGGFQERGFSESAVRRLHALVTQSGETGLSAFLPDPSRRFPTRRGGSGRRATTTTAAEPGSGGGDNVKQSRLGDYFYNNNNNKVDDGNNNLVVVPRLPVAKSWETADFTLRGVAPPPRPGGPGSGAASVREWVLQAIYRYRFAEGSTSSAFVRLETPFQANSTLRKLDKRLEDPPALICVNDDVRWEVDKIGEVLRGWMESRWDSRASWEI